MEASPDKSETTTPLLIDALMEEGKSTTPEPQEDGTKPKEDGTFVDYAPPPRPPVPPPAKYKLCLCIWFTVYFVIWFAEGSGITSTFVVKGNLNPSGAVWLTFMIEIFVMVFCGVELVIGLTRVKIGGKWYGTLPWLMQPRCQWVRKSDNVFVEILACFVGVAEDGFAIFTPEPKPPPPRRPRVYDLLDKTKETVLRAKHDIDPDKADEYEKWTVGMLAHMESQGGFISAEKEEAVNNVHTWTLKFDNINALNNSMATPVWIKMIGELQGVLNSPKITEIQTQHPPINAFVDLFTRQGEATPVLPPKKWKVWWVTTISIFFSYLIATSTLFTYYVKLGWATSWNPNVYRLLTSATLVLILNYLAQPAVLLIVNDWMIRKPNELDTKFPWKQMNNGFIPPVQLVLCLAFFLSTGLVWAGIL